MPHPKKLIEDCVRELSKDYPPSEYTYVIEKAIPNTRAHPDVYILKGEEIVCTVEIGYTRPDKIELYRKLGIKDIRWYSKQMKLILHERDSEHLQKRLEEKVTQEAIRKKGEKYQEKVDEILRQGSLYHVCLISVCFECKEKGIKEEDQICTEYIWFDRKGYHVFFECDTIDLIDSAEDREDHDWDQYFGWDDEGGPYSGKFDEMLKMYVEEQIEMSKKSENPESNSGKV